MRVRTGIAAVALVAAGAAAPTIANASSRILESKSVTTTCESKVHVHTVYYHKSKGVYVLYPTPKVKRKVTAYHCSTSESDLYKTP
jgi:hypothetical protein